MQDSRINATELQNAKVNHSDLHKSLVQILFPIIFREMALISLDNCPDNFPRKKLPLLFFMALRIIYSAKVHQTEKI